MVTLLVFGGHSSAGEERVRVIVETDAGRLQLWQFRGVDKIRILGESEELSAHSSETNGPLRHAVGQPVVAGVSPRGSDVDG